MLSPDEFEEKYPAEKLTEELPDEPISSLRSLQYLYGKLYTLATAGGGRYASYLTPDAAGDLVETVDSLVVVRIDHELAHETEHRGIGREVCEGIKSVLRLRQRRMGLLILDDDLRGRLLELPGELVIWPRTDRPVRAVSAGGGRARHRGSVQMGRAGSRGEYRGLRGYRPGDDPRAIHWRPTARPGEPVIREYEEDSAETVWVFLDLRNGPTEAAQERAVEVAASLAARFRRQGEAFGLAAGDQRVDTGSGPGQLERALDILARVEFGSSGASPAPPAPPERCVLVTAAGTVRGDFGDVLRVTGSPPTGTEDPGPEPEREVE
jgi:hypothetical protein